MRFHVFPIVDILHCFGDDLFHLENESTKTHHDSHAPSMGLVTRSAGHFANLDRSAIAEETSTDSTVKGSENSTTGLAKNDESSSIHGIHHDKAEAIKKG